MFGYSITFGEASSARSRTISQLLLRTSLVRRRDASSFADQPSSLARIRRTDEEKNSRRGSAESAARND